MESPCEGHTRHAGRCPNPPRVHSTGERHCWHQQKSQTAPPQRLSLRQPPRAPANGEPWRETMHPPEAGRGGEDGEKGRWKMDAASPGRWVSACGDGLLLLSISRWLGGALLYPRHLSDRHREGPPSVRIPPAIEQRPPRAAPSTAARHPQLGGTRPHPLIPPATDRTMGSHPTAAPPTATTAQARLFARAPAHAGPSLPPTQLQPPPPPQVPPQLHDLRAHTCRRGCHHPPPSPPRRQAWPSRAGRDPFRGHPPTSPAYSRTAAGGGAPGVVQPAKDVRATSAGLHRSAAWRHSHIGQPTATPPKRRQARQGKAGSLTHAPQQRRWSSSESTNRLLLSRGRPPAVPTVTSQASMGSTDHRLRDPLPMDVSVGQGQQPSREDAVRALRWWSSLSSSPCEQLHTVYT